MTKQEVNDKERQAVQLKARLIKGIRAYVDLLDAEDGLNQLAKLYAYAAKCWDEHIAEEDHPDD